MIREKTVFVVGAGASKEFKFPTGDELKAEIADTATKKNNLEQRSSGVELNKNNATEILIDSLYLKICDGKPSSNNWERFEGLCYKLPEMFHPLRDALSIDNYLHIHSNNENLCEIGKLCIILRLFIAEAECHKEYNVDKIEDFSKKINNTWLGFLFIILTDGIEKEKNLKEIFDNVSFICFNYDRVIEHYLHHLLRQYFSIDQEYSKNLIEDIVTHPYGCIAQLPWQSADNPIPFGRQITAADAIKLADNIKTFTEYKEDENITKRIKDKIIHAKRIIFIGFSFEDINLKLLEFELDNAPEIYVICFEMSDINRAASEDQLSSIFYRKYADSRRVSKINLFNGIANDFIKDYAKLIQK